MKRLRIDLALEKEGVPYPLENEELSSFSEDDDEDDEEDILKANPVRTPADYH